MKALKSGKIKLLLIEDNRILREGIAAMLKHRGEIKLLGAPGSGESAILRIHQAKPDVILLDLGLRSQNSLHVVEMVKKEFSKAKVIVMDLAPAQGDILRFVKAGASGFILKDATMHEFLATIRSVAQGEKVLPPILSGSLFSEIIAGALERGKTDINKAIRMTKREQEIIRLIGDGLSNKEIAHRLHVATYTVKSHIHNIMEKLALHTRLEVADYTSGGDAPTRRVARTIAMMHH
jgi:DNA-binding NarL/FixJ family response regulator